MSCLHGPKEKPYILMRSRRMSTVWRPNARMSNVSKDCGKKNSSVLIAKHFKETLNGFFWKSESDNFLREEYSINVLGLQKIRSTMFMPWKRKSPS